MTDNIQNNQTNTNKPRILFMTSKIKSKETGEWIVSKNFQEKNQLYLDSIKNFGGEVVSINYDTDLTDIIDTIDGWYIPGGADIDPIHYNQEKISMCKPGQYSNIRFQREKEIYEMLDKRVPILGVCYGLQFLNVIRGGTLIQDIENGELHESNSPCIIQVTEDSLQYESFGRQKTVEVGCSHHQAIDKVGEGFKVTSIDDKGMIHDDGERWVLAFQSHPERKKNNYQVFDYFFKKCMEFKNSK